MRLGAALRCAYRVEQTHQPCDGTLPGPKPHIRRTHWHGFWSGSMEGQQRFGLRWLPPIAVNVDSTDALPASVRRVQ